MDTWLFPTLATSSHLCPYLCWVLGAGTHMPTGCLVAPAHSLGAFLMHPHIGSLWKENFAGHLPPSCRAGPVASGSMCCSSRQLGVPCLPVTLHVVWAGTLFSGLSSP